MFYRDRIRFDPNSISRKPSSGISKPSRTSPLPTKMIPKLASPVEVSDTSRSHNETSSSAEEDVSVEPPAPAAQHGNQNWSSSLYVDSEGQIIIAGSLSGLPLLEQLGALHPRPTGLRADPKPVDPPLASTSRERLPGQENSLKRKRADESDTPAEEREGQEDDLDGDEEDGKPILKDGISHAEVWSLCSSVCDQDLMDKLIRQHLTKSEALHRKCTKNAFTENGATFDRCLPISCAPPSDLPSVLPQSKRSFL